MSRTESMDEVTGLEGQWLVIVKGKVVASSENAKEMFKVAEKYPFSDTLVTKVLYPQASFY